MSDLYAEVTHHSGSEMKLSRQRVALAPQSQETGSGPRWRDERLASHPLDLRIRLEKIRAPPKIRQL